VPNSDRKITSIQPIKWQLPVQLTGDFRGISVVYTTGLFYIGDKNQANLCFFSGKGLLSGKHFVDVESDRFPIFRKGVRLKSMGLFPQSTGRRTPY
jgi:hypothetical protein